VAVAASASPTRAVVLPGPLDKLLLTDPRSS
jgi:hypothetical protein